MDLSDDIERSVIRNKCLESHLYFTRFFFKLRFGSKFIVNWHHHYLSDEIEKVIRGETENIIINISPGGSKTELVVINLIARGLAINPMARFMSLTGSDQLRIVTSQHARDIVSSDEFQSMFKTPISPDTKAKHHWHVMHDGRLAGGSYAASMGGQITGFRAGHMTEGFSGALIIDDPAKPEDAYSKVKMDTTNRRLVNTIKSRKANPRTPTVMIMQRLSDNDPTSFIMNGGLPGKWKHVVIPALMDADAIRSMPPKYRSMIDISNVTIDERISYWEQKEPVQDLIEIEKGTSRDKAGELVGRHVFQSQYQQKPTKIGGNVFKSEYFKRWSIVPRIQYRMMYADTAQKTKESNDYSVFQVWGMGHEGFIYLLDQIRGKWESPELKRRAIAFWQKHKNIADMGQLRKLKPEDKSSGTGLIQELHEQGRIPVEGIQRTTDKLTRAYDGLPSIEAGLVFVPDDAPWVNDYLAEFEAFHPNMIHDHDDQIDPTLDAISDMLSTKNKLETWRRLANG